MQRLKYHSAVIFVSDIAQSKDFYTKVLGLRVDMDMGNNIIFSNGVLIWKMGDGHIIQKTIGADRIRNRGNGFELYFETDDIGPVFQNLTEQGVKFLHGIHEEPWGQKTVRIFDPDENIIEIGETLECFINRMRVSGMGIDDIAGKTGMKTEDIQRVLKK